MKRIGAAANRYCRLLHHLAEAPLELVDYWSLPDPPRVENLGHGFLRRFGDVGLHEGDCLHGRVGHVPSIEGAGSGEHGGIAEGYSAPVAIAIVVSFWSEELTLAVRS